MREILFRGKRVDNREWVEGSLITRSMRCGSQYSILVIAEDEESEDVEHPVQFETVGQFTGLTDKNGVKIFEGDIIKTRTGSSTVKQIVYEGEKLEAYSPNYGIYSILYYKGCFGLHHKNDTNNWVNESKYSGTTSNGTIQSLRYDSEIIGNIHDNQELLTNSLAN